MVLKHETDTYRGWYIGEVMCRPFAYRVDSDGGKEYLDYPLYSGLRGLVTAIDERMHAESVALCRSIIDTRYGGHLSAVDLNTITEGQNQ